jgi:hypothetical protein
MNVLRSVELGDKGIRYLQSTLAQGPTLGAALLGAFDLSRGAAFTLLPEDVDLSHVHELDSGIPPESPVETWRRFTGADGQR